MGLIAEEVNEIFPNLIVRNKDGEIETFRYSGLITPLVASVIDLNKKTIKLKEENIS